MRLHTRNATLEDLAELLQTQHARKLDMVVPASQMRAENGTLIVAGAEPIMDDDGVTVADGYYRPTEICDEGIAEKLSIPVGYLKRMRASRPDLYDANVNGWLHAASWPGDVDADTGAPTTVATPGDPRSFMLRTFRGDDGQTGVARAFLSNGYRIVDNLDVLTAALGGVRDAGVPIEFAGCDLTDRKMYVRIVAPQVTALAPALLDGYRSPFDGDGAQRRAGHGPNAAAHAAAGERFGYDRDMPVVFAGFEISNSETGGGAFQIVPRLTVLRCWNGMKMTVDALRAVHLGGRLDDGVIKWSEATQRKSLELVTAQARDAVATFLDVDYMTMVIDRIEAKASTPITTPADAVVQTVCKGLKFGEDRTAGILDHFIRGGQMTAGGVLQAVTSFAQTIDDADAAADVEAVAMRALDLAVAAAN